MKEKNLELEALREHNVELHKLIEYDKEVILKKILDKSAYLEQVKDEVEAYRRSQKSIDEHLKIVDKLNDMRDILLDFCEVEYPQLYSDFVQDVYTDNPMEILIFIRAFIRQVIKE